MDVHRRSREVIQDHSAQLRADFHGRNRIGLLRSSRIYLEGPGEIRIPGLHVFQHVFFRLLQPLIREDHNRADADDTEYSLKRFHRLVKIIIIRTEHVHSSLFLDHLEVAFHRLQRQAHLFYQRVLKKVSVFSLDGDLRIFDQKCVKQHIDSLLFFFYLLEYLLSMGTSSSIALRKQSASSIVLLSEKLRRTVLSI